MANLQDIIAKRKEMGAGATNVDARKALEPVSTTSQANIDQLAANKARVQSQIQAGTRPDVGTSVTPQAGQTQTPPPVTPPAPVTPEGTRTPNGATMNADGTVTPAPVVSTTPTNPTPAPVVIPETTTVPPVDKNAEIKAKNEAQMALNKQQAELRQQERNQVAEETKKANMVTDSGAIFNTLKMGGSVPNNNTPEYRQAQSRYNTFKKFTTYDVASLSTALQSGDLLMGTQAFTDLTSDPTMLAKIQRARAFTNGEIDFNTVGEKSGQYVMSSNPSVAQALADGNMTQEEYNQLTNNDEVTTQAKVMTEKKNEYDKYKRQLEEIDDEVEQEYEGKTVTDTFKSAIKANRDKKIRKLFNSASDEYQNAMGLYTELKNSATAVLAINMEQYKAEQAKQAEIAKEQRSIQAQKDFLQYQSDFEKKQAQEALNDPATQIQATMDEFAKLGIVAQGSLASKVAEANDVIAKGGTLGQYINKLRSDYMAKPEYKKMQELQQGQLSDVQKMSMAQNFDLQKMGIEQNFQMKLAQAKNVADTKWTKLDDGLYQDASGNIMTADEMKSAKLMNNSYISKPVGSVGGDCGVYASRSTGMTATPGGNSKEARFKAFTEKTPQLGGMVFFGGEGYDKTYGHLAYVTAINDDGTMTIRDSNYTQNDKGEGLVGERKVPITSATGFYNNTPLAKSINGGAQSTGTEDIKMQALALVQGLGGTADERQAFADNVIKVAQRDNISLADAKKKLGYKSADDVEFGKTRGAEYKTIKSDTRDKLSNANTALTLLNSPQTAIGDVASVVGFLKTIDPASVARESEVDSVRNARGVVDSLSNQFAQLKEGTKLTDSQRNQLKDAIQTIVNAGNTKYYEYIKDTEQEFKDRGLDPTVYISKTELEKAKSGIPTQKESNTAPVDVAGQLKASNGKTYTF